jgi:hypothetical protein
MDNRGMKNDSQIHRLKLGWKVPEGYRRRDVLVEPVRMEIEVVEGGVKIRQWRAGPEGKEPIFRELSVVMDWCGIVVTSIREELGV